MAGTGILPNSLPSINSRNNNTMAEQRPAAVHRSACKRNGHRRSSFSPEASAARLAQQSRSSFNRYALLHLATNQSRSTVSSVRGCQAAELHRAWLRPTSSTDLVSKDRVCELLLRRSHSEGPEGGFESHMIISRSTPISWRDTMLFRGPSSSPSPVLGVDPGHDVGSGAGIGRSICTAGAHEVPRLPNSLDNQNCRNPKAPKPLKPKPTRPLVRAAWPCQGFWRLLRTARRNHCGPNAMCRSLGTLPGRS